MANIDDAVRSENGVVDVKGESCINPVAWSFSSFYTQREYRDEDLDQMKLSDREYQIIGESLVSRLLALNGRIK